MSEYDFVRLPLKDVASVPEMSALCVIIFMYLLKTYAGRLQQSDTEFQQVFDNQKFKIGDIDEWTDRLIGRRQK